MYPRNADGQRFGRPTYWLRGGWRCSNGAGGAECWNVRRRSLNVLHPRYATMRFAITAEVGIPRH